MYLYIVASCNIQWCVSVRAVVIVFIYKIEIGGHCLTTFQSAALSSTFDVGAMIGECFDHNIMHVINIIIFLVHHVGSIIAGLVSDVLRARAVTSVASLVFAIPSVSGMSLCCCSSYKQLLVIFLCHLQLYIHNYRCNTMCIHCIVHA